MGLFRYGLSATVVLFHFGGLGQVSGRVVVFTFFVLSGYLMALVISRTYGATPAGAGAFYANRALRLVPPFLVFAALTLLALAGRDGRGFYVDPAREEWYGVFTGGALGLGWAGGLELGSWPPVVGGQFGVVPPSWSLVSEGVFYLAAPLLVLLLLRARPLFALVVGGSLLIALDAWRSEALSFDAHVYKNALGSLWTFGLGMTLYAVHAPLRRRLPERLARSVGWAGLALAAVFLARMLVDDRPVGEASIYGYLALSATAILLISLQDHWPAPFLAVDRRLGDLAYGVFLGHFLAAILLLGISEALTASGAGLAVFGRVGSWEFGLWTLALSTVLSFAVFHVVEEPVQVLRRRLRTRARARRERTAAPVLAAPAGAVGS